MTVKSINIKNRTYYFFNDVINIKSFDSNLLKIDKGICYIWILYILIKKIDDYENVYSANPLHVIVNTTDGHIEEKNGRI